MDAVVIIDEFLQEGLVLFQDIIAHVRDVVEESLIFYLPQEQKDSSKEKLKNTKSSSENPGNCKEVFTIYVWKHQNYGVQLRGYVGYVVPML